MKNWISILALSICISACDKLIERDDGPAVEPTSEELAHELENAPPAADGPTVQNQAAVFLKPAVSNLNEILHSDASELGYEIVILVDKSVGGQTMRVLRRGKEIFSRIVSTGAESPAETKKGTITGRTTPIGFFRPQNGELFERHHSETWDVDLYFMMFFRVPVPLPTPDVPGAVRLNDVYGYGLHATDPKHYPQLGTRASGGCVRMQLEHAAELFSLVKFEVGMGKVAQFHRDGRLVKNEKGEVEFAHGYRTLVVIKDGPL